MSQRAVWTVVEHPHRLHLATLATGVLLWAAPLRRAEAEDRVDFKYMIYQEDNDRIRVVTPALLLETDLTPTLSLKIEGVYNAISGASPTGAPGVKREATTGQKTTTTYASKPYSSYAEEAHENENERESEEHEREEREGGFERGGFRFDRARLARGGAVARGLTLAGRDIAGLHAKAGATPRPTPTPAPVPQPQNNTPKSSTKTTTTKQAVSAPAPATKYTDVPMSNVEDERTAVNLDLTKRLGGHAVTGGFAYSTEEDYESMAVALRDAIDFNRKNTTLSLGAALTHDRIDAFVRKSVEDKDTIDLFLGVSQVINPTTLFSANLTLSMVNGYMDDQYKVVELNNTLVPEHRPDTKDKHILYLSLLHMFKEIGGTVEAGYRYYDDSFGVRGDTFSLAWYQKVSEQFTVRPSIRWYEQTAADFYDVTFSGSPDFYSSDYRISALQAFGYGLKVIWQPTDRFAADVAVERYEQSGKDGITPDEVYPAATIVTLGARVWF